MTVMALLGGGTLLSTPLEPQRYLSPVTEMSKKSRRFSLRFLNEFTAAVIVNAERVQDPGPSAQAGKASAKQTESARESILLETKQKPKDIGRAKATEIVKQPPRRHQSVESRKPSVSQAVFKVIGNSFVRDKPSSTAEIIATLHPGTEIRLVRRIGDYFQIRSIEEEDCPRVRAYRRCFFQAFK